ncbi:MAG TPA: hypothetical protein VFA26_06290 [Gemmataceae bacterium]|nr:hypothetical protein [Gemmataceae bacterium]
MRRPIILGISLAAGLAALVGGAFLLWGRPPQMGADEEVFTAVDALFTAVTARDEKLLADCEQRLHALKAAGKLPTEASDYLDGVIKKARAGRWESAAEKLCTFMQAQRREGPRDHLARRVRERPKPGKK